MYVDPDYADASLEEIRRLVAARPFATLVTDEPELRVAHVPVQLRPLSADSDEVVGHVAAADPMAASLRGRCRLLVVVHGPALYVSPRWYVDRGLPTYNFAAIHLHGRAEPLDDRDEVVRHLMSLVVDHERGADDPWLMDAWARARTAELLSELQAFTMLVDSIEAKFKMSQNRTTADRVGVMSALEGSSDGCSSGVLHMMRDRFDENGAARRVRSRPSVPGSGTPPGDPARTP